MTEDAKSLQEALRRMKDDRDSLWEEVKSLRAAIDRIDEACGHNRPEQSAQSLGLEIDRLKRDLEDAHKELSERENWKALFYGAKIQWSARSDAFSSVMTAWFDAITQHGLTSKETIEALHKAHGCVRRPEVEAVLEAAQECDLAHRCDEVCETMQPYRGCRCGGEALRAALAALKPTKERDHVTREPTALDDLPGECQARRGSTMTLREAIDHARERASDADECGKQHAQLAAWLEELAILRRE